MDWQLEIDKNRKSQEQIATQLNNLANTRQVFIQESLRLEGELRILKQLKEENANETPKENTEVPREQDSK